jgi:hypothetical protein
MVRSADPTQTVDQFSNGGKARCQHLRAFPGFGDYAQADELQSNTGVSSLTRLDFKQR